MPKLITSIAICLFGGFAGSFFTANSVGSWYANLTKPALNPPAWIFAPVWTTLYVMMGVALFLVWKRTPIDKNARVAIWFFCVQLILNFSWSPVFFAMRSPFYGLMIIISMWAAILVTMILFYRISRMAAYLLAPYFAWVSFAVYLNASIAYLNR